ncbi:Retinaldehyde-binding protein 1 [Folsomia candida]|uniref:Retinaldehyde-binding protein 1 n=2 Tax=Folsomia candida TaxID=158441 RepID=A0A226EK03_FOLCA|nr:Retinaldehyde-binding protein 1 [Folsomia candida]
MTLVQDKSSVLSNNSNLNRNDSPELLQQLQELKHLMKDDENLKDFIEFFDDDFLLAFIKGKKLDLGKAYTTLVNFIDIRRRKYRHIFKPLVPSKNASLNAGILRILKNRDHRNRFVLVNRTWKWNCKQVSADDTNAMFMLIMDEYFRVDCHKTEGLVGIFDMFGFSMDHVREATPNKVYQLIDLLWKNVPVRYTALHIVNTGFFMNCLLKIVHPFLPKKVRERLIIHSNDLASLHAHIPKEILPESLGGPIIEEEAFDINFEQRIRNKEEYYQKFSE